MKSQGKFSAWIAVLILIVAMLALACNLGVAPTTPTPRVTPTSAIRPTVSIQSPQNNADGVVGQPIVVQASGTHPDGITRLELLANSQQVDSRVSQNPLGDQQFTAYLNYTPTASGVLILQVIAYRNNLPSDVASITVNVKSQAAQVTATVAIPVNATQVITDDPTCRARVEVNGLNFRQGPAQNYPPMAVLGLGNVVYITGRTADNTWWQGRVNNTIGWMSASFITLLGNCYSIQVAIPPASPIPTLTPTSTVAPTAAQASAAPGKPDLIVSDLVGPVSIVLDTNGTKSVSYTILVQNIGTADALQFNVGLVMPDGTLQDLGQVPRLVSGQKAQLQANVTFTAPGSARITAVVDTNNTVDESNESNNLKALDVVLIKPTAVPGS